MTDRIDLTGLSVRGRHGALPDEQVKEQTFVIDVRLFTDHANAVLSDDLTDTIDYGDIAQRVHHLVGNESYALIETLADRIAAAILDDHRIDRVEVTVHKPEAPIEVAFDDVSVTVDRHR